MLVNYIKEQKQSFINLRRYDDYISKIVGYSGIDFLKMNGVISPGTYYDCLNREYINKTGLVVTRNIYTKDTCDYLINK